MDLTIRPGEGIGPLQFGDTPDAVRKTLDAPDQVQEERLDGRVAAEDVFDSDASAVASLDDLEEESGGAVGAGPPASGDELTDLM